MIFQSYLHLTLACVVKLTQGEKTVESRLQDRRREKVSEEEPQLPLTSLQLTLQGCHHVAAAEARA